MQQVPVHASEPTPFDLKHLFHSYYISTKGPRPQGTRCGALVPLSTNEGIKGKRERAHPHQLNQSALHLPPCLPFATFEVAQRSPIKSGAMGRSGQNHAGSFGRLWVLALPVLSVRLSLAGVGGVRWLRWLSCTTTILVRGKGRRKRKGSVGWHAWRVDGHDFEHRFVFCVWATLLCASVLPCS